MRKILERWQRVGVRVLKLRETLSSRAKKVLAVILAIAGLAGWASAKVWKEAVTSWFMAGHSHQVLLVLVLLLLPALWALYEVEKESDQAKELFQVREKKAILIPVLGKETNVFMFTTITDFRNNTSGEVRLYVEKKELLRRRFGSWKSFGKEVFRFGGWYRFKEQKLQILKGTLIEIPPREKGIICLSAKFTAPGEEGPAVFLRQRLKGRLTFDVLGKPGLSRTSLDVCLPFPEEPPPEPLPDEEMGENG